MEKLAEIWPQLYLNPDHADQQQFRKTVLSGEEPDIKDLSHFECDPLDSEEMQETPVGLIRVVTLHNRKDYETFIRCMMAAKEGMDMKILKTQGASMLNVFNWQKIHHHMDQYAQEELAKGNTYPDTAEEFRRFTSIKENYIEQLAVLSCGPYSNIPAEKMGCTEDEWLVLSDTIRRYHELTHVICRRLYPDKTEPIRDELIADAVGLYAAYGSFDIEKEKIFLGIENRSYTGGRLENYTDQPEHLIEPVCDLLEEISRIIKEHQGTEPFGMVGYLEEQLDDLPVLS